MSVYVEEDSIYVLISSIENYGSVLCSDRAIGKKAKSMYLRLIQIVVGLFTVIDIYF